MRFSVPSLYRLDVSEADFYLHVWHQKLRFLGPRAQNIKNTNALNAPTAGILNPWKYGQPLSMIAGTCRPENGIVRFQALDHSIGLLPMSWHSNNLAGACRSFQHLSDD